MDGREKLVEQKIKGDGESICYKCFHNKVCKAMDNQPCVECNQFVDAHGVTVLPCKIGDEFWTDWVGITKVKCSMLTQKADGSWKGRFSIDNGWGSSVNVSLDEIGKTLFKTKEEAEANLPQPPKGE